MSLVEIPLVGRQDLLKLYRDNLSRAINYQGNILVLSGPPGIGKTRLLQEFIDLTNRNSVFTCYIKLDNSLNLYEFFGNILSSFLNRPRIGTLIPLVIDENFYSLYVKRFPILKAIFPYEPKGKIENDLTLEMGFQFCQKLAQFLPAVFVCDDFHNANKEIKDYINFLSRNIFNMPILIILGTRIDDTTQLWIDILKSTSPLHQIDLEPFTAEETHLFNHMVYENQLPKRLFDWIYLKTRGNPLFTKEFLLFLMNKGIIFFDAEKQRWAITRGYTAIDLPDTIFNIIKEQIEVLSPNEKNFVTIASLLSQDSFTPDMLNCEISTIEIENILHSRLLSKQENKYTFVHHLIKETIYNFIPAEARKNLHNKLGNFLLKEGKKEEAVYQFISAGLRKDKLLNLLIDIVNELKEKKELKRALFYEKKALELISSDQRLATPQLLPFFVDSANSLRRAGQYQDALNYYKIALRFVKNLPTKKKNKIIPFIYKDMTFAHLRLGNNNEVIKLAEKTRKFLNSRKIKADPSVNLHIETNRTFAYANLGNFKNALELAEELKQKYERFADLNQNFRLNYCFANIYHKMGEWQKVIIWSEKALVFARKLNDERYISATCGNLGIANMLTGNFKKAEELFHIHQDSSVKNGWIREQLIAHLNFGNLYFFQGYLTRAEEEFDKAIKIAERLNLKTDLFWIYYSYTFLMILKKDCRAVRGFLKRLFEYVGANEKTFKKLYYFCEGYINALEKDTDGLNKTIEILQNEVEKINEDEEYLLLKGLANLPDKKAFYDIENSIEKVLKKNDNIKSTQLLILVYIVVSGYKGLKKEAIRYRNMAIEHAKNYDMQGWVEILSPEKSKPEIIPLKIYTFGKLSIELPDKRYVGIKEWQWAKPRQLFTILLTAYLKKQKMTRDEIGSLLWPELSRDKLVNNFHVCLNQLKSVVGKEYIELKEKNYTLTQVKVDAEIFDSKTIEAENLLTGGKIHTAEQNLKEAIEFYKGRFLEGFYDDWVLQIRDYFSEKHRQAVLTLGDIYLKKAQTDSAIDLAKKLLVTDPLDEEAHRFLIHCYTQSGEKAKAIAQYKRCESIFKKELGCEPSEKTRELYRNLL